MHAVRLIAKECTMQAWVASTMNCENRQFSFVNQIGASDDLQRAINIGIFSKLGNSVPSPRDLERLARVHLQIST